MFKVLLLGFCLLLPCVTVNAGTAAMSQSFLLRADLDTVRTWLKYNQDAIVLAAHYSIVKRNGEIVTLQRQTSKGLFIFDVQENITDETNTIQYVAIVVPNADIQIGNTHVTLSRTSRGTRVDISIYAIVNRTGISNFDVRIALSTSLRGIEKLFLSRF